MAVQRLESTVRRFSGAHCFRVSDANGGESPEHHHDWPILSLYILGRQTKIYESGETTINGPAAVLHSAGAPHANRAGRLGLEQLDIEFDPAWLTLNDNNLPPEPIHCWVGGQVGAASRALARDWFCMSRSEEELIELTRSFLSQAVRTRSPKTPRWLPLATHYAEQARGAVTTRELAHQLGLHPAWLTQAYRAAMGEGIQETAQRKRLELAVTMLRYSSLPFAEVAVATGFCDQSHLIRICSRLLGRTPVQIRTAAANLGPQLAPLFGEGPRLNFSYCVSPPQPGGLLTARSCCLGHKRECPLSTPGCVISHNVRCC
jgi:AraC family transcriptional regulator